MKVLVADPLSKEGIEIMKSVADVDVKTGLKEAELIAIIGNYEGMVVRSQTTVTPAIIEAGTGVGKSFAYLIPAAIAISQGKKVVISTHTHALQAQLFAKDIPALITLFVGRFARQVGKPEPTLTPEALDGPALARASEAASAPIALRR